MKESLLPPAKWSTSDQILVPDKDVLYVSRLKDYVLPLKDVYRFYSESMPLLAKTVR